MAALGSHPNVWDTCLQIIHKKGFSVRVELSADDDSSSQDGWIAEKNGFDLVAENPIELLGLVAIYETVAPSEFEPYWWVVSGNAKGREELYEEAFASRDQREQALRNLRLSDPVRWKKKIAHALDNSGNAFDAASQLGISEAELEKILALEEIADSIELGEQFLNKRVPRLINSDIAGFEPATQR